MPLTPQITLTINLDDLQGTAVGSTSIPAYVRIALCNYGPFLPRINGTAMIARVGPYDIPYTGSPLTVNLWGNDVITPPGTYYAISILDAKHNVLQTAAYVFNGTVNADLSTISPTFPSAPIGNIGFEVQQPFSSTPTFISLFTPIVAFAMTLSGNVTSSTILTTFAGQIVIFKITQNATGGFTFAWPTNVQNPGVIDPAANSKTVQAFYVSADGNLYPLGPQTYN